MQIQPSVINDCQHLHTCVFQKLLIGIHSECLCRPRAQKASVSVWGWGRYQSSIKCPILMSREVSVSEHPWCAATSQPEKTTYLAAILVKINMASFTTAPPGGWGRKPQSCPQKVLDKMSEQIMKE